MYIAGLSGEKSLKKNTTDREKKLEKIIKDIWWMARRYADGRKSYAVSMYNDAIDEAILMGVDIGSPDSIAIKEGKDGIHAKDGMFDSKMLYRDV